MAETLFNLATLLPMPAWGAMLLFPRAGFTRRLVTSPWPFVALAGLHALFLAIALFGGAGDFALSFGALRAGLSREWAFLALWTHLLVLDLFAGVWIFRDAKYWGVAPALYLVLTLVAGPLGLGLYLWRRERLARHDPVRSLN